MLDLKFVRENTDLVEEGVKKKKCDIDIKTIIDLDAKRRALLSETEELKAVRNKESAQIAIMLKEGKDTSEIKHRMKEVSERIKQNDVKIASFESELDAKLLWIPNLPHCSTPEGTGEKDNQLRHAWGEKKIFDFKVKPHWEIAVEKGLVDFDRAAKISGSGFVIFKGQGARLERALIQFMLDVHTTQHGYTEISPPVIVNRATMTGTGQLPKMEEDMYLAECDEMFLIPTAEVPVTNILRDETLNCKDLPLKFCAYTPCFRREAGSYGKDTRGLIRLHQFDKVELVKFVEPESSYDELEKLLGNAETILQLLGLHYRVIELCSGDLSFAATKCYDIEVWSPALEKYLEVSSCSNFEDFQARRMGVRYKKAGVKKTSFVHTLNGSGLAMPRTMIAIIENYQQADGSIIVPEVLRAYMGGAEKI